jgi:hypothetical protein
MTTEEYIKHNAAIGKFMGLPQTMPYPSYHASIDLLMPVLQKISKNALVEMRFMNKSTELYVSIWSEGKYYQSGAGEPVAQIYTAVVAYLEFLNAKKTSHGSI